MHDYTDILNKINALISETRKNSISPARLGEILYKIADTLKSADGELSEKIQPLTERIDSLAADLSDSNTDIDSLKQKCMLADAALADLATLTTAHETKIEDLRIQIKGSDVSDVAFSHDKFGNLKLRLSKRSGNVDCDVPAATVDAAGVMSSNDKTILEIFRKNGVVFHDVGWQDTAPQSVMDWADEATMQQGGIVVYCDATQTLMWMHRYGTFYQRWQGCEEVGTVEDGSVYPESNTLYLAVASNRFGIGAGKKGIVHNHDKDLYRLALELQQRLNVVQPVVNQLQTDCQSMDSELGRLNDFKAEKDEINNKPDIGESPQYTYQFLDGMQKVQLFKHGDSRKRYAPYTTTECVVRKTDNPMNVPTLEEVLAELESGKADVAFFDGVMDGFELDVKKDDAGNAAWGMEDAMQDSKVMYIPKWKAFVLFSGNGNCYSKWAGCESVGVFWNDRVYPYANRLYVNNLAHADGQNFLGIGKYQEGLMFFPTYGCIMEHVSDIRKSINDMNENISDLEDTADMVEALQGVVSGNYNELKEGKQDKIDSSEEIELKKDNGKLTLGITEVAKKQVFVDMWTRLTALYGESFYFRYDKNNDTFSIHNKSVTAGGSDERYTMATEQYLPKDLTYKEAMSMMEWQSGCFMSQGMWSGLRCNLPPLGYQTGSGPTLHFYGNTIESNGSIKTLILSSPFRSVNTASSGNHLIIRNSENLKAVLGRFGTPIDFVRNNSSKLWALEYFTSVFTTNTDLSFCPYINLFAWQYAIEKSPAKTESTAIDLHVHPFVMAKMQTGIYTFQGMHTVEERLEWEARYEDWENSVTDQEAEEWHEVMNLATRKYIRISL